MWILPTWYPYIRIIDKIIISYPIQSLYELKEPSDLL